MACEKPQNDNKILIWKQFLLNSSVSIKLKVIFQIPLINFYVTLEDYCRIEKCVEIYYRHHVFCGIISVRERREIESETRPQQLHP